METQAITLVESLADLAIFISAVVTGYLVAAALSGLGRGHETQMKDRIAFNKVTKDLQIVYPVNLHAGLKSI